MNKYESVVIEIPNHECELEEVEKNLDKLLKKIERAAKREDFTRETKEQCTEFVIRLLERTGDLSVWAFNECESLEKKYYKLYPKQPELAKVLFLEHYEKIHNPYDRLKNRLYNVLEYKLQKIEINKSR